MISFLLEQFTNYNTRVVFLGTVTIGLASGFLGVFLLLRRHSLLSDAISHTTLPGIGLAFLLLEFIGGMSRSFIGLILGAFISSLAGIGIILFLRLSTRLHEDSLISITLSSFFGLGALILGFIQKMPTGSAAGLTSFIYGKTASMLASDAFLILGLSSLCFIILLLVCKEMNISIFDRGFAQSQGFPVSRMDLLLAFLCLLLVLAGLQAVGLIMMVALIIIPAVSARFWTHSLTRTLIISSCLGGLSCGIGTLISASFENLPTGALIVLVSGGFFCVSALFGRTRGIVYREYRRLQIRKTLFRDQFLLFCAQKMEPHLPLILKNSAHFPRVHHQELADTLMCSFRKVHSLLTDATARGWAASTSSGYQLTRKGVVASILMVRRHELQHLLTRTYPQIVQSAQNNSHVYLAEKFVTAADIDALHTEHPQLFHTSVDHFLAGVN